MTTLEFILLGVVLAPVVIQVAWLALLAGALLGLLAVELAYQGVIRPYCRVAHKLFGGFEPPEYLFIR